MRLIKSTSLVVAIHSVAQEKKIEFLPDFLNFDSLFFVNKISASIPNDSY